MEQGDDLDSLVRRVDPHRWLSSRFIADREARADVIALYAFDHELARAPKVASNPLIAEIRLTWWREVVDEIFEGRTVRAHPTARAIAGAVRRRSLGRELLEAMIAGRIEALGQPGSDLASAVRLSGGSAAVCAASMLVDAETAEAARPAGEVWAEVGEAGFDRKAVGERLVIAGRAARRLPSQAFPAVAHVALARDYMVEKTPSAIRSRFRLIAAVLTGSL